MLVPPPAIQKIYAQIKKKHGVVKRDVFYNTLADRLNLSVAGIQRLQRLPALQVLPFDDEHDQKKVDRKDAWGHLRNKHTKRGSEAGANRALAGNRPLSPEKLDIIKRLGG